MANRDSCCSCHVSPRVRVHHAVPLLWSRTTCTSSIIHIFALTENEALITVQPKAGRGERDTICGSTVGRGRHSPNAHPACVYVDTDACSQPLFLVCFFFCELRSARCPDGWFTMRCCWACGAYPLKSLMMTHTLTHSHQRAASVPFSRAEKWAGAFPSCWHLHTVSAERRWEMGFWRPLWRGTAELFRLLMLCTKDRLKDLACGIDKYRTWLILAERRQNPE